MYRFHHTPRPPLPAFKHGDQVVISNGHIPGFKGNLVFADFRRGLHVHHLISIRRPLFNRPEGSQLDIFDYLLVNKFL
jgi:hypothetical protein